MIGYKKWRDEQKVEERLIDRCHWVEMLCYIYFNAFKAKNDVIFHCKYSNINVKKANNFENYIPCKYVNILNEMRYVNQMSISRTQKKSVKIMNVIFSPFFLKKHHPHQIFLPLI